jgi:hypothetical protein
MRFRSLPLFQPLLKRGETKVPVSGHAHPRRGTADLASGRYDLFGFQGAAALLTLVAPRVRGVTIGALPFDIAIRKETAAVIAVTLIHLLRVYVTLVIQIEEELLRDAVVQGQGSAGIIVELYSDPAEALLHHRMVAVDDFLGRDLFLVGPDRDGDAVFIRAADVYDVAALQALVANVYVCRDVSPREVAQVQGAVRIGQSCGHQYFLSQASLPGVVQCKIVAQVESRFAQIPGKTRQEAI